jgi:hypothetical protein
MADLNIPAGIVDPRGYRPYMVDLSLLDNNNLLRKKKLSAIGTLLEKAVIKDPHRALNGE